MLIETGKLYDVYKDRIQINYDLDRTLVSFQANKSNPFFNWFKYKEGFSATLIEHLLYSAYGDNKGVLLDPFAGTGSAMFMARDMGWRAIGIEFLPVGQFIMQSRVAAERVDVEQFNRAVDALLEYLNSYDIKDIPKDTTSLFNSVMITRGAFSEETLKYMKLYKLFKWSNNDVRQLLEFACFSILESISYTQKDGAYLRWDHRSGRFGTKFDKGYIPDFKEAITNKLNEMRADLNGQSVDGQMHLFKPVTTSQGSLGVKDGSCLNIMLKMESESIDVVITSPPYCNRYDYTRNYALELVYLGNCEVVIKDLRQSLLSSTTENKDKMERLRSLYSVYDYGHRYDLILATLESHEALQEVIGVLEDKARKKELNNVGIPKMVKNYFYEMGFVVFELARVLKHGGKVFMVNDNVQYAGVEIPVDLILSDLAVAFGLKVDAIWVLPRGKGNSPQQMERMGRKELRKCTYVWSK